MELAMMVATQLNLKFSGLPDRVFILIRRRKFSDIALLKKVVATTKTYVEVQLNNDCGVTSDKEILDSVNNLLDHIVETNQSNEGRSFYSKMFSNFEVLFTKRIEEVIRDNKEFTQIFSRVIPGIKGARLIECKLIDYV